MSVAGMIARINFVYLQYTIVSESCQPSLTYVNPQLTKLISRNRIRVSVYVEELHMGKIVSRARQARLDLAQRLGRDVSVQEVATAIGITRAALHKIESDETFISRPVLAKLCEFYKLQPGDLLKYEDRLARYTAMVGTLHSVAG
jgi:DNA-binding Xre family transcriptional regulator